MPLAGIVSPKTTTGGLGLHSTQHVNTVSMAKLAWRVQKDDTSLWSRVNQGQYSLTQPHCSAPSPTWRGIKRDLTFSCKVPEPSLVTELLHLSGWQIGRVKAP